MQDKIAILIVIIIIALGITTNGEITGHATYSWKPTEITKPDITVGEILEHGVNKEKREMYIHFTIENSGELPIKKGTEIYTRIFVKYRAPPVKQGDLSLAEVFLEEVTPTYILEEDLYPGETIIVESPPVPILLSTVRFFERYDIKNRITIQLDADRQIQEADEKNNQKRKWYYMQEWEEFDLSIEN
jgi:hypothetical protein